MLVVHQLEDVTDALSFRPLSEETDRLPLSPTAAAAMDMLASANSAILNTRTSVDRFTNSLDNLAESVGTAAFVAIMAGAFALSAGLGNASLFALARIDESFFQPLIARISSSETWADFFGSALEER